MVELRHYEATNGWEGSSGLLESVQRTANNQRNEPSAQDKYWGPHRHDFKIKACPTPLVEWTSVNGSLILLMQTAKRSSGDNNAGYLTEGSSRLLIISQLQLTTFTLKWNHQISSGSSQYHRVVGPTLIPLIKCWLLGRDRKLQASTFWRRNGSEQISFQIGE